MSYNTSLYAAVPCHYRSNNDILVNSTPSQHYARPIHFGTAVLSAPVLSRKHLLESFGLEEMIVLAARHSNRAVKACRTASLQQQSQQPQQAVNSPDWHPNQAGLAVDLKKCPSHSLSPARSGSNQSSLSGLQQQQYSCGIPGAPNYSGDQIPDPLNFERVAQANTIDGTNTASSTLWERKYDKRHYTTDSPNSIKPSEEKGLMEVQPMTMSDADFDYSSWPWPWQSNTAQSSFLEKESEASAQICSPSALTSSSHNSWSAVDPTLTSLSSWSLQFPLASMSQKERESTFPRYEDKIPKDLDNLHIRQSTSNATTTTSASNTTDLNLFLEASPSFSSSETSLHSDTEHLQQGEGIAPSMIDNGLKRSDFSENLNLNKVATGFSANTKGRVGTDSEIAAPRSIWQLKTLKYERKRRDHKEDTPIHSSECQTSKKVSKYEAKDDFEEADQLGDEKLVKFRIEERLRYRCPIAPCKKDFSTSGHARRHSRIHTYQRPFMCPHARCDRAFTRRDNCTQHQRSNHGSITAAFRLSHDLL